MVKEHVCIHIILKNNKYILTTQNSKKCEEKIDDHSFIELDDKVTVIENIVHYIQDHLIDIKNKNILKK